MPPLRRREPEGLDRRLAGRAVLPRGPDRRDRRVLPAGHARDGADFVRRFTANAHRGQCGAALGRANFTAQHRAAFADPYAAERERSTLLRALAANQCGPQYDAYAIGPQRRGNGLFAALFGNRSSRSAWRQDDFGFAGSGFGYGTYRTLCVRLCDGYYFPVSFSTLPNHFQRDASACESKCAAPAELYYHQNPGGAVEQMVSVATQQPYTSLKAAWRYRKEFVQGCSCKAAEYQPAQPGDRKAEAPPAPAGGAASGGRQLAKQ